MRGSWNRTTRATWASERRPWFIYVLVDPGDERIRYIGLTCNPASRERGHANAPSGSREKDAWARTLDVAGTPPQLVVIDSFVGHERGARKRERVWIRRGQRAGLALLNVR